MESDRDLVLDGNAAAGVLQEIFGDDMTNVRGTCDHCASVAAVGQLVAYIGGPGIVLRCPACSSVMIRIAQTSKGTYVDARGVRHLRMRMSSS
jgi:hypothetical protein